MAENPWKFSKPAPACCQCVTPFATGEHYYSALVQQPEPEGLTRKDYCTRCFDEKRPADVFYFWKTSLNTPEEVQARRRPPVDIDYVFEFFRRLDGDPTPQRIAFRYILALMLTRQKMLVFETKKKDNAGQNVQVYREKRGGQTHSVIEPILSEEEIASVSTELGVLLGMTPAQPQTAEPAKGPNQ